MPHPPTAHAWVGPWPPEIQRRLDQLSVMEHDALEELHDRELADTYLLRHLDIVAEFDLACAPRHQMGLV